MVSVPCDHTYNAVLLHLSILTPSLCPPPLSPPPAPPQRATQLTQALVTHTSHHIITPHALVTHSTYLGALAPIYNSVPLKRQ